MKPSCLGRYLGAGLVAAAALLLVAPGAGSALGLSRAGLVDGQAWRWLTGHLVHWNFSQLVWDGLVVAVLWPFCWDRVPRRTALAVGGAALLVPPAVLLGAPLCAEYRGLSGLAAALFVLAVGLVRDQHAAAGRVRETRLADLLLFGFVGKMGFEALTGGTVFADLGGAVSVPVAHVAGAVAGWVALRLSEASAVREAAEEVVYGAPEKKESHVETVDLPRVVPGECPAGGGRGSRGASALRRPGPALEGRPDPARRPRAGGPGAGRPVAQGNP